MPYEQPVDLSLYAKTADIPAGVKLVDPNPMTCANLYANYPPVASLKGYVAQVTDLWNANIFGFMRCGYNGRIYYWEPTTQPTLVGQMSVTTDTTIQPLSSYPIIELTGNIPSLTTVNVTAGITNGWPGAIKEFRGSMTSLLGTLNILGVGTALNLALGGTRRIGMYDNGTALVWRQLT